MKTIDHTSLAITNRKALVSAVADLTRKSVLLSLIRLPQVVLARRCRVWDGCNWQESVQCALQGTGHVLSTETQVASHKLPPSGQLKQDHKCSTELGIAFRPAGTRTEWGDWAYADVLSHKTLTLHDFEALVAYHNIH